MSQVQTTITKLRQVKAKVLKAGHITEDQYSAMMFKHGCAFIEHFCRSFLDREDMIIKLQQDPKYGFWPWFKYRYSKDDILLVENDCLGGSIEEYEHVKGCLTGDELLENDLYHFISPML